MEQKEIESFAPSKSWAMKIAKREKLRTMPWQAENRVAKTHQLEKLMTALNEKANNFIMDSIMILPKLVAF